MSYFNGLTIESEKMQSHIYDFSWISVNFGHWTSAVNFAVEGIDHPTRSIMCGIRWYIINKITHDIL